MIFLCVGTQFSFDRLVRAVDDSVGKNLVYDTVYAQIGETSYIPRNFEYVRLLNKTSFDECVIKSSAVISHAGMGIISTVLDGNKPMLAMPRLKRYREVVNDHQLAIAKKFSELGHILVAYDIADLPERIRQLKSFVPKERKANPDAVADRIRCFLNSLRG